MFRVHGSVLPARDRGTKDLYAGQGSKRGFQESEFGIPCSELRV